MKNEQQVRIVTRYLKYFIMTGVCELQLIRIIIWKNGSMLKMPEALFQEVLQTAVL